MKGISKIVLLSVLMPFSTGLMIASGLDQVLAQGANPCAPKAANPCAPNVANTPAGRWEIDPMLVRRPAGIKFDSRSTAQLTKEGKALFKDPKLSTNGMACASCHLDNQNFAPGFAKAYPHEVAMAKAKSGLNQVHADEMVQLCMMVPMGAKPLPWDSRQLAALSAYVGELQIAFRKQTANADAKTPKSANPCAKAVNPCAPKK